MNFVLGYGYFFQEIFTSVGYFLVAIFTYLTFHKEKKDYLPKLIIFLALFLIIVRNILGLLFIIDVNPITRYFERILITCYISLIFYWLGLSSFSTFKRLQDREIAPWLKVRYITISIVSFLWPFHVVMIPFLPWDIEFGDPTNLISFIQFTITVILSLIFIIGMTIAWIIPQKLKDYINHKKGYQPSKDRDLTEDELMSLISEQLKE
jgi:hypothetical protein